MMQKTLARKIATGRLALQPTLPFSQKKSGARSEKPLDVERRLSDLLRQDLTFKGEKTSYASHNIHAFAAKFPPQIPRIFINELTKPGEHVLDPMVGSGTVLIEAVFTGRFGVAVDLDPLASLISHVKSTPIDFIEYGHASEKVLREARETVCLADDSALLRLYSPKSVEFFRYWFTGEIINELFALINAIRKVKTSKVRTFLKVIFSSCIITKSGNLTLARDLAHSRPHRDLARQIKQSAFDVFQDRMRSAIISLDDISQFPFSSLTIRADSRSLPLATNSVHLIVTSPPYAANAIDYMRAHKFSLMWLGYEPDDLSSLRSRYIGAELKPETLSVDSETGNNIIGQLKHVEERRAAVVAHYYNEMKLSLLEMLRVLMPGRAAVLVVGSSIIKGTDIKAPTVLAEIAASVGFHVVDVAKRDIVRDARMMPTSHKSARTGIEARMHEEGVIGLIKPLRGEANANTRTNNAVHSDGTSKVGKNPG